MNNKRADISQIQKYLNGELDARAMHRLEREAQDDPFLMDALEGYGQVTADQQHNLAALRQRLQQRTEPTVRRLMPWTTIAIAASVIGFVVIAGLFFYKTKPTQQQPEIALNQPSPKTTPVTDSTPVATDKAGEELITTPPAKPAMVTPQMKETRIAQTAPAHHLVMREISPARKHAAKPAEEQSNEIFNNSPAAATVDDAIAGYMMAKRQDTVLGGEKVAINKNPSDVTVVKSKADGVTYKERESNGTANAALIASNLPPGFSGVVMDKLNGTPIPGATVKIVGQQTATQTDASGRFTLPNLKKDEQVAVNFLGYNSKTLPAKAGDSAKVELDQNTNSLAEVVMTNIERKGSKAAPRTGWDAFRQYLYDNALTTDGASGTVTVQFSVDANGTLSAFKIIKSLNTTADAKAIDLIRNGTGWFANANGKPETVKVDVRFRKAE